MTILEEDNGDEEIPPSRDSPVEDISEEVLETIPSIELGISPQKRRKTENSPKQQMAIRTDTYQDFHPECGHIHKREDPCPPPVPQDIDFDIDMNKPLDLGALSSLSPRTQKRVLRISTATPLQSEEEQKAKETEYSSDETEEEDFEDEYENEGEENEQFYMPLLEGFEVQNEVPQVVPNEGPNVEQCQRRPRDSDQIPP